MAGSSKSPAAAASEFERTLLRLLRTLPRTTVVNRLNRIALREIALAVDRRSDICRLEVLGLLSQEKRRRVVEELELQKRLRIRGEDFRAAGEHFLSLLSQEHYSGSLSGYLRPLRPERGA